MMNSIRLNEHLIQSNPSINLKLINSNANKSEFKKNLIK